MPEVKIRRIGRMPLDYGQQIVFMIAPDRAGWHDPHIGHAGEFGLDALPPAAIVNRISDHAPAQRGGIINDHDMGAGPACGERRRKACCAAARHEHITISETRFGNGLPRGLRHAAQASRTPDEGLEQPKCRQHEGLVVEPAGSSRPNRP